LQSAICNLPPHEPAFASSPASAKALELRAILEPEGFELVTPDLNVPSFAELDFEAIVTLGLDEARQGAFDLLAGSSMGSLVALELARRGVELPLVLIAPAFALGSRWIDELPDGDPIDVPHHATGTDMPIHRRFFERMVDVHPEDRPPSTMVTLIAGRLDESVPFEGVESTWSAWRESGALAPGSRLVAIADGDHSLTDHVELIASEIRRSLDGG